METYNHELIEKKWQDYWYSNHMFKAIDFDTKPKYYCLIEFPYPSGAGMHVGHIKAFASLEVVSRKRRMEGYNVLFPIGFDAFGLPTENYAIKNNIHPRIVTDNNIKSFKNQLMKAGFSFDFDRVIDTTDENYYKWTQWIFNLLFKNGLAYKSKTFVNYCPNCKVVLSNEESQGGKCDRCDSDVIQLQKDVWFLKITDYSLKLLEGLDHVDYPSRVKTEQINWIGKSEGAEVLFALKGKEDKLKVFTTRPDTLYGVTFMVIAPEHPLIEKYSNEITNLEEVRKYQEETKKKTEFERINLNKTKTGILLEGLKALNPLTNEEINIFVSDYVMMGYGTGAIMAVPAHDTRDYAFAKKFNQEIKEVIQGGDISKEAYTDVEDGILINSPLINGKHVKEAKEIIINYLEQHQLGKKMVNFKMKDWAFNRQRYWGEPIPVINCPHCGQVLDENLPLVLPDVEKFEPGANGESPLAKLDSYINCKCPKCGRDAKRETDTMPQWAGSSWYFLRYCDPNNNQEFANYEKLKYWMPVDWYNGGMEHVTRHMIYSRFWNQFLYDQGLVPVSEPYAKRTCQGLILGSDGEKMSKSKGNVVDPLDVIKEYGADTLRTYILFLGEYEQPSPWSEQGVKGVRRFLERVFKLKEKVDYSLQGESKDLEQIIHKTIKEVSFDIENTKFNTAISKLMILSNEYAKKDKISKEDLEVLIKLLNPFAPHICEQINEDLGNKDSLVFAKWPTFDENKTTINEVEIAVQVNGKLRATFKANKDESKEVLEAKAKELDNVKANLEGKTIRKVIVVVNKIVNIVAN
ncbi:MAG: leucine--tRNA ligase [Bacilli bacterium]|nr:leucine--tRNA ligase [Bacilli bacterium]